MALFTDEQLHTVRAIIRDHHNAFIVNTIGPDAVPPDVLEHLRRRGLVAVEMSAINDAYAYGQHVADGKDPRTAAMSFDAFNDYMRQNPLPLGPIEQDAVQMAKHQAAQLVVGLGNRVEAATGQLLIEADAGLRSRLRGEIRTKTADNLARRETVKKLESDLGWATKDWARDWDRIAITEKQTAMQRGLADHYARRFGPDTRVAKRVMPDACEHCKRLYLGPDGQPRIFKLSDLEANGTNFRRRASDWLPVVGATHPHCQCQIVRVPAGWGFNEEGDIVPGGELGAEKEGEEELSVAAPGEGTPTGTRLVIPLDKAELKTHGTRVGGSIAAQPSRAGHRNPGRGTVVNFVVGTRRTPPPTLKDVGYHPEQRDLAELRSGNSGLKLPREAFDFAARLPRATHAVALPGDYYVGEPLAPEEPEERQRELREVVRRNLARPRNLAEPDEDIDLVDPAYSDFTRH